jgi:erythromycin esterase-like protein
VEKRPKTRGHQILLSGANSEGARKTNRKKEERKKPKYMVIFHQKRKEDKKTRDFAKENRPSIQSNDFPAKVIILTHNKHTREKHDLLKWN